MATISRHGVPDHVRDEQIVDYDYFADARVTDDPQLDLTSLHGDAPDIFYSPRQGGFWVVTRYDLMSQILRDTDHFSNRELDIPKSNSDNRMIPLNLDPPEHLGYRMALMRHFDRKHIAALEPKLRWWANHLIDKVIANGGCEFTEDVGAGFPVSVFMELMGLPLDRFEQFRDIVHEYFGGTTVERRIELQNIIIETMRDYFARRRSEPQDDLMSKLVQEQVKGRPLTDEELDSIGFLLFIAGLDTVANTLTFTWRFLAEHPELQGRLANDPDSATDFVEEALRRFSIVQQTRVVKKDYDFEGVSFREGDMVACPLMLGGMDDRRNPEPTKFDIDRQDRAHVAFSTGPHTCVGNFLARAEMRVLAEEWIRRIPRFRIKPGTEPKWRMGGVMALSDVHLEWDAEAKA
ncbi:cytochrome P450 [Sphingomonas sp. CGMCC 1.13654]|uniref:Cytochrome P450 n=1 Tax=Sphingomonas chungangi TaxID=2683589 RepID=A0A838L6F7_9SPHN|nr:cytochrome P450 [Sphingomonas chungangi]MBA2933746.1 cytochrome P450 [Sphingomonas chungangi]MVW55077.1 cytochrome P450 [Sphingomonas chungangi]